VLAASRTREEKENITRACLASGELGLDYYKMRDKLKEKGLKYVDQPPDAE
jgi:4-hydroxy-4-methyl-2-oxoglutarate aldolase